MANVVICPGCEHQLRVKPELVGKRIKCPSCKSAFTAKAELQSSAPRKIGQPIQNKDHVPTFKDKLLEGSGRMISGLGTMAVGFGLLYVSTRAAIVVLMIGFATFLYGLAGTSDSDW